MSGFDEPWKQSWAREADKVKELAEHNRHLRAALVKAEDDANTWRQRAEEAEECIVWVKCDDPEHERLTALATENQAMRAVVDAAKEVVYYSFDDDDEDVQRDVQTLRDALRAIASLPPVADERTTE